MEIINVRLPEKVISDIDKLSKKHELTRSEVMRQALTMYLHLIENVGTMLRPIVFQVKPAQISYTRKGDVNILRLPTGHFIVSGSTAMGAVGPKKMDKIKVDGHIVGKFLARVALMDVTATGAFPLILSLTLGVEKDPTGTEIIEGISREARTIGLEPNQVLMEKTEDNFQTLQTGAGLTVTGLANENELRVGKTLPGDLIVAIGRPKVGNEVIPAEARGEIADLKNVVQLTQRKYVHDIAPVGGFGIASEARMMAYSVDRQLKLVDVAGLDFNKTAGPATVVLATIDKERLEDLQDLIPKPIKVVGEII
jgi:selenophosphate synthetase-related protein